MTITIYTNFNKHDLDQLFHQLNPKPNLTKKKKPNSVIYFGNEFANLKNLTKYIYVVIYILMLEITFLFHNYLTMLM